MKLSKEELLEKVKTYVGDRSDDETLEIIEDISDSFESSESAEKIEEIKTEYESKLANLVYKLFGLNIASNILGVYIKKKNKNNFNMVKYCE